jgi:hypothetical protein
VRSDATYTQFAELPLASTQTVKAMARETSPGAALFA